MTLTFSLPKTGDFPNSTTIVLVSAESANGQKTEYGNLPITSGTYYEFSVPGEGPWEITLRGWYGAQPPVKVNNANDIIAVYNDAASVTSKAD